MDLAALSMLVSEASFGGSNPIILSAAISLCSGSTLFLVGVWATLQFKWKQLQYPVVCLAFERLLFAATPPVAVMILAWGTLAAVGPSHAPFYQAAVLSGLYCALAMPVEVSFGLGSSGRDPKGSNGRRTQTLPEEARIQGSLEGCVAAALTVTVPPLFYTAVFRHNITESEHLWSVLSLSSAPLVLLALLEDGLWWLPLGARQREAVRKVVLLGSVLAALGGLEGRVIFRAFGQYIMLHPPWSYLVVTVALYGAAALLAMYFAGMLTSTMQGSFASTVAAALLIMCACGGAFAAGVPLLVMPAPLVAASGLVLWFESGQLRDYAIFFAGTILTSAWFLHHHFWFLEVYLSHVTLQFLCKLLLAAVVIAATLPGVIHTYSMSPAVIATLLAGQAVLVAALEENLYGGVQDDADDHLYPAAFVVLTSALGFYTVSKLQLCGQVGPAASWLTKCIYVAKLSILLIPEARLTIPVLLVTLAVTPPFLLQTANLDVKLASPRQPQPPPWQGLVQAGGVAASVFHARFALFEVLQRLNGGRPTEALLLGCLLLGAGIGCMPLVLLQHSQSQLARRALVLVAALGMLLVMLRPPLPVKGGVGCPGLPFGLCPRLWDLQHSPSVEEDDAAIYSEALARRRHWPKWLIVGAVAAGLWAATGPQSRRRSAAGSLLLALVGGTFTGAYLMWEFFPNQPLLQMLVFGATILASVFLVLVQQPGRESATWLLYVAAVWALLLPVTSFIQANSDLPPVPGDLQRLYSQSHLVLDAERSAAQRGAVLAIWASQALLMALVLKLRVSRALDDSDAPPASGSHRAGSGMLEKQTAGFLGSCLPSSAALGGSIGLRGAGGAAMHKLAAQGLGWAPTVGNLCTLLCFVLALALNAQLNEAADEAILVLVPMLLLLNQDPLVFSSLTARRRYAPLVLAVAACLVFSAVSGALQRASAGGARSPFVMEPRQASGAWLLTKNLALLVLAVPIHVLFLRYVWARKGAPGSLLVGLCPFSTMAAIFTDLQSIRLLSGIAIAMAAIQFIHMRSVRHESLRII